jgi:hypothetical protein
MTKDERSHRFVRAASIALAFPLSLQAFAAPNYPITVRGGNEASVTPMVDSTVIRDPGKYDTIVVGAGLGGLSAALYLTDHHKRVLLLEKEPNLGGLASSGSLQQGIRYDRGAAYWTDATPEEQKILNHIGLGDFAQRFPIHEPIDSYLWKGKLYLGVWDEATLKELPRSFTLFRSELQHSNDEGLIPDQPLEEAPKMDLDRITAAEWIRRMPAKAALRTDKKSKKIYRTFQADASLDRADPMKDVIDFLDLYCRSALGTTADQVSAMAFANFYLSELITRYTTQVGTADAADRIEKRLRSRPNQVRILTSSPVGQISNVGRHVEVKYVRDGRTHVAMARYAVFAMPLKAAPKIIENFKTLDPAKAGVIQDLGYADYSVHSVRLNGHPYRATYDTWSRPADYTENDFTDFILGRWMDPKIKGYEGMRDFRTQPAENDGLITIYHPLPLSVVGAGFTDEQAKAIAERAVDRLTDVLQPVLTDSWGTRLEVTSVETNRWPFSVHVARPGHFIRNAKILRKPVGRIFFGENNLGTPAFEEALFRGHCAANNVLLRLDRDFHQEKWSKCPVEAF